AYTKLMPTQWRTIAPIVGRTPSQCLERYQRLLDEAEAKEGLDLTGPAGDTGPSADDVRRLRPGEIDPDPETKPARPDPVDMDEDEARARLANTQGKKAKRKAREKQLEEARRLASLQKRRELKAAVKKKKKGMDYNADIPFEKRPALGFYDTTEEKNRQPEMTEGGLINFVPARNAQLNKLKQAEQINKRRKLILPAPQVGETELEEIVKIGFAGQNVKAVVGESDNVSSLTDYTPSSTSLPLRTPRTPRTVAGITQTPRTPGTLLSLRTPRTPAAVDTATIKQLRAGLLNLPAPKNDFEIVLPDVEGKEVPKEDTEGIEEDASDRDKKLKAQQEEEAVQRDLPRPVNINSVFDSFEEVSDGDSEIQKLIDIEMLTLLRRDAVMHPVHGSKPANLDLESFEEFPDELIDQVKKEIDLEFTKVTNELSNEDFDEAWSQIHDTPVTTQFHSQLEANRNVMIKEATKATKLEKKLNVILGALSKNVSETFDEIEQAKIELDSFQSLSISEREAIPK
ncbi:12639_t:CDS:10, partial [Racocetra fulgida]